MKKLLFSAFDMDIGGIETSLCTLLDTLVNKNYDVTLVLENKNGIFLSELNPNIHLIEYNPNNCKCIIIRKFMNLLKRIKFIVKYMNKFDFSASYATYSKMAAFTAKIASKNNAIWVHSDYTHIYKDDIEKMKTFFYERKINKFKHIIFVSKSSINSFVKIFPELKEKIIKLGNLINYEKMLELSNEKIEQSKKNKYIFLSVGRHSEEEKKLSRIIMACENLKNKNLEFEVWIIGTGKDTLMYEEMIKDRNLEDYIKLLGIQKNPYPYFKTADAILLTSDYEGYPVVFQEAFVFEKPVITTDVSDAMEDIENKFGKVVKKEVEDISLAMEDFIINGYEVKEKFDAEKFNKEILEKLENLIENKTRKE